MKTIKERIFDLDKDNPYLAALKQPEVYFYRLAVPTVIIGFITAGITYLYMNSSMHDVKVPNGIHSLVGFVIAMLLVFRTNTAYDRWWEGRKKIQELNGSVSYLYTMVKAMPMDGSTKQGLNQSLRVLLEDTKKYLMHDRHGDKTQDFHKRVMDRMHDILKEFNEHKKRNRISDAELAHVRTLCKEILDQIIALERIKNTPIPLAYSIHIKVSIFIFLITLPFSMFYDLNMWATPIVMILYFLIAGIDLISTEIENPFSGEPNDLPVEALLNNIKQHIV
jgi:putative membrane protein